MIRSRTILLALLAIPVLAGAQTVSAESAVAMDAASGKILWSRNADEELYPASCTKIMTSLLLIEHCKPDDVIVAPADVRKVRESSMHLFPGEQVKAKDMLFALLLRSANDGCYAVACHISGGVAKFSELMNQRAKELGCTHTHFDNPNGLNDPLHYTTAHDLALIARQAMQSLEFRHIVATKRIKINRGTNWHDLWMVNHDKILFHDPTCDGIKTGWTIPAGHCFVGSAVRNDWRVITVVMKSKHWQNDTEDLFKWSYDSFVKKDEAAEGAVVGTAKIAGGTVAEIPVQAAESAYSLIPKTGGADPTVKLVLNDGLNAPVARSQKVGELVIRDADGFEHRIDAVAGADSPQTPPTKPNSEMSSSKMLIGAGLLVGTIYFGGRKKRRVHRFPFANR